MGDGIYKIYFAELPNGTIKIGHTVADIDVRIRALECQHGELSLLGYYNAREYVTADDVYETEGVVHRRLRLSRAGNHASSTEVYFPTLEVVAFMVSRDVMRPRLADDADEKALRTVRNPLWSLCSDEEPEEADESFRKRQQKLMAMSQEADETPEREQEAS